MTRAELASLMDVGETTVDQWVSGRTVGSALVLDDMCEILECSLHDIYPKASG